MPFKKRYTVFLITLFYLGLIWYLSSLDGRSVSFIQGLDKPLHLIEYSVLGALLYRCLGEFNLESLFFASFIACLYGIIDEFHQSFVPGRDASMVDLLFDSAGGLLGAWMGKELRLSGGVIWRKGQNRKR